VGRVGVGLLKKPIMKKFIVILILSFCAAFSSPAFNAVSLQNQVSAEKQIAVDNTDVTKTKTTVSDDLKIAYEKQVEAQAGGFSILGISLENILLAGLSLSEIIVRLIPSAKDNSILNFFTRVVNFIVPNLRKGGGAF
jgi:hypothetical protein